MSSLQQNLLNPNNQPLVIGNFSIRQDEDGRYCLNDLHKASGGLKKHQLSNFLRTDQTQELIKEIEQVSDVRLSETDRSSDMSFGQKAINVIKGGLKQGTYAVKEIVYAYAMWISAKFHLMVIRAYDSLVMEWMIGGKQTISPEQCGILYNIVHTRAGGNQGLIRQMWSRLKNHFKYSASYRELRAIHFEDAKHYLEVMDLKGKTEKQEVKSDKVEVDKHYHQSVQGLAWHMLWVREWWKEFGEPLRKLSPNMAGAVHDHFVDGAMFAFHFIDKDELKKQQERMNYRQWHLSATERFALEYRNK